MSKTEDKLYDIIQYTVEANKNVLKIVDARLGDLQFKSMLQDTNKIDLVEQIRETRSYINEILRNYE